MVALFVQVVNMIARCACCCTGDDQNYANLANDLPGSWVGRRQKRNVKKLSLLKMQSNDLATLQDPSAVVVYNITDPTNPVYDSITQLIDYTSDSSAESTGECEGLAVRNGYVLVANTEDPSVCLLRASWAD